MKTLRYHINLNNEISISISAKDRKAKEIIDFFAKATLIKEDENNSLQSIGQIFVVSNKDKYSSKNRNGSVISKNNSNSILELEPEIIFRFPPRESDKNSSNQYDPGQMTEDEWTWRQLTRLSSMVGGYTLLNGGFLIHSGLVKFAVQDNIGKESAKGILLSGASGSGKTSASRLFTPPWYSLSDDLTIITKNIDNTYSAHPLPTWSSFFGKELSVSMNSWDMEKSIPLSTVVFLDREDNKQIEKTGSARSLCLLMELAKQANEFLLNGMDLETISSFNKKVFLNINEFIRNIPAYTLNLDLGKQFWKEMEEIPEIMSNI